MNLLFVFGGTLSMGTRGLGYWRTVCLLHIPLAPGRRTLQFFDHMSYFAQAILEFGWLRYKSSLA